MLCSIHFNKTSGATSYQGRKKDQCSLESSHVTLKTEGKYEVAAEKRWKGAFLNSFLRTSSKHWLLSFTLAFLFVHFVFFLSLSLSAHQSFVTISNSPQVPQLIEPPTHDIMQPPRWDAKKVLQNEKEFHGRNATKVSRFKTDDSRSLASKVVYGLGSADLLSGLTRGDICGALSDHLSYQQDCRHRNHCWEIAKGWSNE